MEPFNIFELFWVSNGAGWGHGFFHLMLVPYLHFLMRGGLSFRHPLDLDLLILSYTYLQFSEAGAPKALQPQIDVVVF